MIRLSCTSKHYGEVIALSELSYTFHAARRYSIVGPSGCGKSTLLNLISGLDPPTCGTVNVPSNTLLGYVFQNYPLLPWRNLIENLSLGFQIRQQPVNHSLIRFYLNEFRLGSVEFRYPHELSGGMRQRAALIQALSLEPEILLLDEPFSSMDFDLKIAIQRRLVAEQRANPRLLIFVTHDLEDAIALSDEILILGQKPGPKTISVPDSISSLNDPLSSRVSPDFASIFSNVRNGMGL